MAKILIVDDRPTDREFLKTLLGYKGYRLCEAGDGVEALATARVERPDLIISDLLMPTMDGFELLRQLHVDPALAAIPVIFYTAKYHLHETQELEQLGNVHHLGKPSDPEVILTAVEQSLAAPRSSVQLPAEFDRKHLSLVTDKLASAIDQLDVSQLRLEELGKLGRQLSREEDVSRLLELCCKGARHLFAAKFTIIVVLTDDRTSVQHLSIAGLEEKAIAAIHEAGLDLTQFRRLLDVGRLLRLRTGRNDSELMGLLKTGPNARSMLLVPMSGQAALILFEKIGAEEFSAEDEWLATSLGSQLTLSWENARLREAIRQITPLTRTFG